MERKRVFVDSPRHQGMRKKLVDELRQKGITNEAVLAAVQSVPRHFFLDTAFEDIAYENRAFPIAAQQTISHPYTVAYQTQLLEVAKFQKILEIGTGSMYQSVVLSALAPSATIFTIERQKELFDAQSKLAFRTPKYLNIKTYYGDGFAGLKAYAPFDRILVTAAAPFVPPTLLDQLKVGGKLVIPVDEADQLQRMLRITKQADGSLSEESFEAFSFVPMLQGKNK
ncbi:MAG: protein-L-isoaspartate(D-aspartate) O-methyltransferase [Sphingobacteriia bacterium]|nr:MAG: protein-L-isoaspartate(D-aspartate) O-methyltransferase [Sphingobacteriia bacterium]